MGSAPDGSHMHPPMTSYAFLWYSSTKLFLVHFQCKSLYLFPVLKGIYILEVLVMSLTTRYRWFKEQEKITFVFYLIISARETNLIGPGNPADYIVKSISRNTFLGRLRDGEAQAGVSEKRVRISDASQYSPTVLYSLQRFVSAGVFLPE